MALLACGHGGRIDGLAQVLVAVLCSPTLLNLLVLLSLLSTNLLALLAFLAPRARGPVPAVAADRSASTSSAAISAQVAAIAREIDATRLVPHRAALPPELLLFLSPHALPLGRDARTGLTHMPASVAHACFRSPPTLALLAAFTSYEPRSACPHSATLPHRSSPRDASCPAAGAMIAWDVDAGGGR